jgi:hypothetical protein
MLKWKLFIVYIKFIRIFDKQLQQSSCIKNR